jgi:hypothetical protein
MKDTTMASMFEGRTDRAKVTILWIVSVILFVFVLVLLVSRSSLTAENKQLTRQVASLEQQLAQSEEQLMANLRAGELTLADQPGFVVMKFNELISLDVSYVRALLMIEPSYASQPVSYQLLLENKGEVAVVPEVSVEFFDRSGESISVENLRFKDVTELGVGESRTVSGSINLRESSRIAFFSIKTS